MPLKHPVVAPISKNLYILKEDYIYSWRHAHLEYKIHVPRKTTTDLASVPRWLWSITGIRPDGLHRGAAVVHDFIYINSGLMPPFSYMCRANSNSTWEENSDNWTRYNADRLFLRMLKKAGVGKFKRWAMFKAVRTFGGPDW